MCHWFAIVLEDNISQSVVYIVLIHREEPSPRIRKSNRDETECEISPSFCKHTFSLSFASFLSLSLPPFLPASLSPCLSPLSRQFTLHPFLSFAFSSVGLSTSSPPIEDEMYITLRAAAVDIFGSFGRPLESRNKHKSILGCACERSYLDQFLYSFFW